MSHVVTVEVVDLFVMCNTILATSSLLVLFADHCEQESSLYITCSHCRGGGSVYYVQYNTGYQFTSVFLYVCLFFVITMTMLSVFQNRCMRHPRININVLLKENAHRNSVMCEP